MKKLKTDVLNEADRVVVVNSYNELPLKRGSICRKNACLHISCDGFYTYRDSDMSKVLLIAGRQHLTDMIVI